MKIRKTVQRQFHHLVNSCVQMARVFQRREFVITLRTVTAAWMKVTVLALTPHNGVVQEVRNVFLLVTSAMEQKNVH